ncbi:hypothetical protein ACJ5XM_001171 [Enterobacter hormaechei]|nr:hypothetical protein [Enterobacter hormaechei]ELC6316930.1 hypothetical protein [Enterobacter hormaechei]ELC6336100.1 hypothetical protein [Enterobacter hormaechei]ELC6339681.1 hypothetical protein [Enterobacter hormaechei]ELJ2102047.1 hypothetical protein [Enterobacter hormaechei]
MIQERQNILNVKIQAEQLNFLMQTIHAHHNDFDCHQLNALLGLAYDIAGSVYDWTNKEEQIVLANDEAGRKGGKHE